MKKSVARSRKVAPSEKSEKVSGVLDDIEEPVVMIRGKYLYNFQGQSTASTGWFNMDH